MGQGRDEEDQSKKRIMMEKLSESILQRLYMSEDKMLTGITSEGPKTSITAHQPFSS